MDHRYIKRALISKDSEGKTFANNKRNKDASSQGLSAVDDAFIEAYDQKETLTQHAKWIQKLREGNVDVTQFLSGVSPDVAVNLLDMAMNGQSEKIRYQATADILDRAGYSKVQKVAVASIDPNASKEELISMIKGLSFKTKAIEIIDEDIEERPGEPESRRASSDNEET